MPRSLLRPRRPLVASETARETASPAELEQPAPGDETTALARGDLVEVEDVEGRSAASAPHSGHPAPDQGEQSFEGPAWQEAFQSPEEMWDRYRNIDHLRGRQANELGQLRRQVGLYERTIRLLAKTVDPFERQTLVQAAGLIPEPQVLDTIEEMLDAGEALHGEEVAA